MKKTPTPTKKSMLLQVGLGCKKIKLLEDDTDEDVLNKLTSDAKDEFGNTLGFPQPRTCGGFEMLQRLAKSKNTSVSGTLWCICDLQSALGGQAKIYLRPKQPKRSESLLKEKCRWCQKPFLLSKLREHSLQRTGNFFGYSDKDATDLPAVMKGGPESRNNSTQSSLNVPIFLLQHSSLLMYIQHPVHSLLSLHPRSVMYSLTPAGSSSKCKPLLNLFGFHLYKMTFWLFEGVSKIM